MNGMTMYLATGIAFYMTVMKLDIIVLGDTADAILDESGDIGLAVFLILAFFMFMAAWPWLAWKIYRG